jgi:hypothetical protein
VIKSNSQPFRIEDGQYGVATAAVKKVVEMAASHEWFPPVGADDGARDRVRSLLGEHLAVLAQRRVALPSAVTFEFVRGGWGVLADAYRECNPVGFADDPAYARGVWRTALGELVEAARQDADARGTRRYFVPPLFPVEHNPVIVRQPLTATYDRLEAIVGDPARRDTVWYMMCGVDADYWDAILWEIAYQPNPPANPFHLLIETYSLGYYPLGTAGDSFVIYSRE